MTEEHDPPNLRPYRATLSLLSDFGKLLGALLSLSVIAYLVGWVYGLNYFHQFGAGWLMRGLNSAQVVSFSLMPLFNLAVWSFIAIQCLEFNFPNNRFRDIWIWLGAYAVVNCGFSCWAAGSIEGGLKMSAIVLAALLAGALFAAILLLTHKRESGYSLLPGAGYIFALAALWLLPSLTAWIDGSRDADQKESVLPRVTLVKENSSMDLRLLHSDSMFYVVDIATATHPVYILPPDRILSISGEKTSKQSN